MDHLAYYIIAVHLFELDTDVVILLELLEGVYLLLQGNINFLVLVQHELVLSLDILHLVVDELAHVLVGHLELIEEAHVNLTVVVEGPRLFFVDWCGLLLAAQPSLNLIFGAVLAHFVRPVVHESQFVLQ